MLFAELKKNLVKDFSSLPVCRLGLVGDSATQFVARAIKAYGYEEKINFQIFEADYDQLDHQILDRGSELYHSDPEYIVLCLCVEKLSETFAATDPKSRTGFADAVLSQVEEWWTTIAKYSRAKVIHLNFTERSDGVFGHFAAKTSTSFMYQVKKINLGLMTLAQEQKHVFVVDVAGMVNQVGYPSSHDPRLYATAKVAFALDFLPQLAKGVVDIVRAASGNIKKCLILDLDNTVWGGVIGDDGLENIQIGELGLGHAFDNLQRWAKELQRRGILIAVCSKNEEDAAKKPFLEHPDMILRLDDISVFVANWDNKAENIKRIQETLNIGFDSMVFVDDNPFERNLVRELLPAVTVPELPEDPALVVPYLCSLNLFETASFSEEDLERTRQYQEELTRTHHQKSFASIDEYLGSLQMISTVKAFDEFSVPRIAQLCQRSNQFNLRTIRYTEGDIDRIRKSPDFLTLAFDLQDRFGSHGLIGVIILKKLDRERAFVDTWIMSCRVLKRGMEEFIVNQMVKAAIQHGLEQLVGEYIPTPKNKMVSQLYSQMGFAPQNGKWELNFRQFNELNTSIDAR